MEDVSRATVVILLIFAILISIISTWSIINAVNDAKQKNILTSFTAYETGDTKQSAVTSLIIQGENVKEEGEE